MTARKEHQLARRDIELAPATPFRNRQDGDLTVKSCAVRFSGLKLSAAEFCDLVQEPLAHRALYCKRPGETLDEPLFKTLGAIPITTHLAGRAFVYCALGDHEIDLGIVTVTNLKFETKYGGLTEIEGVIQATPVLDGRIAELIDRQGSSAQLALSYEHEAEQQELPIGEPPAEPPANGAAENAAPNGSADPEFEAAAKSQVAAFKRGRKAKGSRKGAH